MKFRKKPVEVDAANIANLLTDAASNWAALPAWVADAYEAGTVRFLAGAVEIHTLEGVMRGERDDWLIRGVRGELYPCKPDVFAATYEAVPA